MTAAQMERPAVSVGFGCGLVFPVAFFGMLMLIDYPRHSIWWTLAELFGWGAICLATAYFSTRFLARFKQGGTMRWLFLPLAIGTPVALGWLLWLEIQPTTPDHVKLAVEYALRVIGVAAIAAVFVFIGRIMRSSLRRSRPLSGL